MKKKRLMILRERLKRLKIELKFRLEDDTIAYFLPIEDEKLVLFLDVWAQDTFEWWQKLNGNLGMEFLEFSLRCLNRTYLHELIHWAVDEITERQCERMALKLAFGDKTYRMLMEALIE